MSFPQTNFFGNPKGWEDLGRLPEKKKYSPEANDTLYYPNTCKYCNEQVHIGKEGDKRFWFCPKCMQEYQITN